MDGMITEQALHIVRWQMDRWRVKELLVGANAQEIGFASSPLPRMLSVRHRVPYNFPIHYANIFTGRYCNTYISTWHIRLLYNFVLAYARNLVECAALLPIQTCERCTAAIILAHAQVWQTGHVNHYRRGTTKYARIYGIIFVLPTIVVRFSVGICKDCFASQS